MSEHYIRNNALASRYHLKSLMLKNDILMTDILKADAKREASLFRVEKTAQGIIGALVLDGVMFCDTLEHPTLAVPAGCYVCKYEYSDKFERDLYELKDVPGRTECKFHVGNTIGDTIGCILQGKYTGHLDGARAVFRSSDTIDKFHAIMNGDALLLSIYNIY